MSGADSKTSNVRPPASRVGSGVRIGEKKAQPASSDAKAANKTGAPAKGYGYNGQARRRTGPRGGLPTAAGQILALALRRHGLEPKLKRYEFVARWDEIVGKELARRTRPGPLLDGVLTVFVASSSWAQELSFHKLAVLKRIQHISGSGVVDDVRFSVGNLA